MADLEKYQHLPGTVAIEHQAMTCGSLATPHRNLNCVKCESTGKVLRWFAGIECKEELCEVCGGKGELSYKGERL